MQRDAPVRFKPRFDPDQWQWILRFLQACNGSDKLRSVAALLPLSLYSQRLIHDLVDKDGFEFDYRQNGKLIIHRQRRSFEAARTLLQKHRELSEFQQALDRDACLALEPSLLRIAERIAGGLHTASEEAGDCYKL
ncbi:MAG: FAD-dependent oxidoreductase, partial [Rhodocyclaceae bacterium]|nr:FAD-dependent oxidoreductase [Rhodocyclaceae bacterium]